MTSSDLAPYSCPSLQILPIPSIATGISAAKKNYDFFNPVSVNYPSKKVEILNMSGRKKKKKKKKKKMSKKKLRMLEKKREEEERLRKLAEEQALREAEERRRREEEEARIREEKRKAREAELARLKRDRKEFQPLWTICEQELVKEKEYLKKNRAWVEYMECSHLPRPSDVSEINAYVSLWRDGYERGREGFGTRNISSDFDECDDSITLYHNIEREMYQKFYNRKTRAEHRKHMTEISRALVETMDDLTAYVMQYSDKYVDEETSQFHYISKKLNFGLWINNLKKNTFAKHVLFKEIGSFVELKLRGSHFLDYGIRVIHYPHDFLSSRCNPYPPNTPLGGIVYIDFLNMPPAPQTNPSGWSIRKVTELSNKIERRPYKDIDIHKRLIDPDPTKVIFKVGENVLLRKDIPRVAWWNEEEECWSQDGISFETVHYDKEKREITFCTTKLTTAVAIVHERVFDVPFRKWFIRPMHEIGINCAIFHLTLKEHRDLILEKNENNVEDLVFFLWGDKARLIHPLRKEFKELNEGWENINVILKRLAEIGINLILYDSDAENTERVPKTKKLEKRAYRDISYCGTVMAVGSSKWNHDLQLNSEQAVFRIHDELLDPSVSNRMQLVKKRKSQSAFHTGLEGELSGGGGGGSLGEEEYDPFLEMEEKAKWENFKDVLEKRYEGVSEEWVNVLYDEEKSLLLNCTDLSSELDLEPMRGGGVEKDYVHQTEINLIVSCEKYKKTEEIRERVVHGNVLLAETLNHLLLAIRPLSWC